MIINFIYEIRLSENNFDFRFYLLFRKCSRYFIIEINNLKIYFFFIFVENFYILILEIVLMLYIFMIFFLIDVC